MRTLTPSWIIESAMVAILPVSPSAFWMSAFTPASSNAFCRYGLSKDSHRADDCVSGRITPTWAPPPAAGEEDAAAPALEDVAVPPPLELEPQAATASEPAATAARVPTRLLRMLRSFPGTANGSRDDSSRMSRAGGHMPRSSPGEARVCCGRKHMAPATGT